MNTTKIGNEFEGKTSKIIRDALLAGQLGIHSEQCKIFHKKGYFSKDRGSMINFDLTIEVWPPGAQNFTLLFVIECKSYSNRIPINDVEEFHDKIRQVAGVNAKGILVTNAELQEAAYNYARSKGMMVIQVNLDETYAILLYRIQREWRSTSMGGVAKLETWDDIIGNTLESILESNCKVEGLKQLSAESIEERALEFLKEVDEVAFREGSQMSLEKLSEHLEHNYSIKIECENTLGRDSNGNQILGYFERDRQIIHVDSSLVGTDRFLFTLGHEVGHVLLHSSLKVNNKSYNRFKDAEYNFVLGKHELGNPKNWIEWQANQFSACLIIPKYALLACVLFFQKRNGIRNPGSIYYDNQPVNRKDFYELTIFLSNHFMVSYTSLKYRLHETGILTYADQQSPKHWSTFIRSEGESSAKDPRRYLRTD